MPGPVEEKPLYGAGPAERPKRPHLFLQFSILSFIAFLLIGYFVVGAIRPAIQNFVVSRQEADTVVFVNRLANRLLEREDFAFPASATSTERLTVFVEGLQVPARLAVFVTNRAGLVLVSDLPETNGRQEELQPGFLRAAQDLRSAAGFRTASPQESELLGVAEVFELYIPVTFGASPEAVGVVHSLSRTGFIRETVRVIQTELAVRITIGLLFLYAILAVIVWGASRTIRRQAAALHGYATTLEDRVRERTRALEESTRRELAQAKELSRLKDEFVFIATHELRAPVTTLSWSLELIKQERRWLAGLPRRARDYVAIITASVDRLRDLIQDLLNVARLESGTVKIQKAPLAIADTVSSAVTAAAAAAEAHGVVIRFSPQEFSSLPPVIADARRLQEVFSNLLTNAVKFNRPRGEVRVRGKVSGPYLEIAVADTGSGIKREDLPQLFTKFFRAREDIEGTGLGLWISKEIMRRLDGDLTVQSSEGKGSTFTAKIPLAKQPSPH